VLLRLTLLLIALPLAALAADAPSGGGRIVAPPPRAAPPPRPAPAVSLRPLSAAPAQDPTECRRGCAQSYYFCRSTDDPGSCGGPWTQCLAACDAPSPDQGASSVN
jgi:hypothetical protein